MINKRYRLIGPRHIKETFVEEEIDNDTIFIRPTYMSICASDQRYYNFDRPAEILKQKLPMALIHEAIGEIVYDPLHQIAIGECVILVPLLPNVDDAVISENYIGNNFFRSSGYDGFLQDIISQPRDRVVVIPKNLVSEVLAFAELMSVAVHAIGRFLDKANCNRNVLGVWGDGNLGFILALFLKKMCPDSKVVVFGVNRAKLDLFSFADDTILTSDAENVAVDHAFECVGGSGSKFAINQIVDLINPEGCILLLGVSENFPSLNTRLVLEKGLSLIGSSRSCFIDFLTVVAVISNNTDILGYLRCLINAVYVVRCVKDVHLAFDRDMSKDFGKTILKWEL